MEKSNQLCVVARLVGAMMRSQPKQLLRANSGSICCMSQCRCPMPTLSLEKVDMSLVRAASRVHGNDQGLCKIDLTPHWLG